MEKIQLVNNAPREQKHSSQRCTTPPLISRVRRLFWARDHLQTRHGPPCWRCGSEPQLAPRPAAAKTRRRGLQHVQRPTACRQTSQHRPRRPDGDAAAVSGSVSSSDRPTRRRRAGRVTRLPSARAAPRASPPRHCRRVTPVTRGMATGALLAGRGDGRTGMLAP